MPYPAPPHDPERRYISRASITTVGLEINVAGAPADVDGDMTVAMVSDADDTTVFQRTATRAELGVYEVTVSTIESGTEGNYTLMWSFELNGIMQADQTSLEIGPRSPDYDRLDDEMKMVVESVYSVRFGDLFDNDIGGPHLRSYYQTHFNRNRVAQLLRIAVGRLNTVSQPHQTYSIDGPGRFPVAQWGALLEQALYIEAMKHLRRSYVEQPAADGVSVARLDRRDYMSRWGEIIAEEERTLAEQLDSFKIASMGLGRGRVLVAGGIYGNFTANRPAGMAGRPRYWARFY